LKIPLTAHLITAGFLCLALLGYAAGFAASATLLVVLGMLAELAFWWRLLRRRAD